MIRRWRAAFGPAAAGAVLLGLGRLVVADQLPQGDPARSLTVAPGPDLPPPLRVDAVVIDRSRRGPVLDLKPTDFELLENGVPQPIDRVELRTSTGSATPDVSPILTPDDESRAAHEPGTRLFAIVLDEFHVSPGDNSARARAAMTRFIDDELRPADLALVIKPLDTLTALRFTRDRALLREAVDTFEGRRGDLQPRSKFEEQYIGRSAAAVTLARAQIATAALREVTMKLGDLQADRAAVVVVSEGFARVNTGRLSRNADIQGVVRAAARFTVPFYTFSPADRGDDVGAVDPSRNDTPAGMLQWLAAQTGGQAVLDGASLQTGLARMAGDLSAYYVLTYQPQKADGRFHSIEVKTARRDALVRTLPGFWAPLGGLRSASLSRGALPFRALHRSPLVDVWTGITRGADGRARLNITWEPKRPGAIPPRLLNIKARSGSGQLLFEGAIGQVGGGASGERAVFDVPAGRVELDLAVQGMNGATLDTDLRDVDVPAIDPANPRPMLLTPEIVVARTVREFAALKDNPDATPTPDRVFSRSDRLIVRAPAWDSAGGAGLQVTASVLNRWGQPMRSIARIEGPPVPQFELPLSWLAPGDYAIALTAKNDAGQVSERVTFTVSR